MKPQDPLHELVQSLTQGEKKHFSLYAKRHVVGGGNNYKWLFDQLVRQKVYNEKKLKTKLDGQLNATRHHLHQLLLDSLTSFHRGKTIDSQINNYMERVAILFQKGLIEQCRKHLKKARKLAEEQERFPALQDIIMWERRLHSKTFYKELDEIKQLHLEETTAAHNVINTGAYFNLYVESFTQLILKGRARTDEGMKAFNQILNDPLMADEEQATTYTSKVFFHSIHANYCDSIGDDEGNHAHQRQLVELLERKPKIHRMDFNRYITIVDNYCISGIRLGQFDACLTKLEDLDRYYSELKVERSPSLEARIFTTTSMHKLCAYYRQGGFDRGLPLLPEIQSQLDTHARFMLKQRKHDLMYDIFYTYFGNGQFRDALKWLNACITDDDISMRPAEISSLKILEIIVHYELDNEELVSFLVRNHYRYLMSKGQLHSSEKLFLDFIRKQQHEPGKPDMGKHFRNLMSELKELQSQPYERMFMDPFNVIAWLESKTSGRTFRECCATQQN